MRPGSTQLIIVSSLLIVTTGVVLDDAIEQEKTLKVVSEEPEEEEKNNNYILQQEYEKIGISHSVTSARQWILASTNVKVSSQGFDGSKNAYPKGSYPGDYNSWSGGTPFDIETNFFGDGTEKTVFGMKLEWVNTTQGKGLKAVSRAPASRYGQHTSMDKTTTGRMCIYLLPNIDKVLTKYKDDTCHVGTGLAPSDCANAWFKHKLYPTDVLGETKDEPYSHWAGGAADPNICSDGIKYHVYLGDKNVWASQPLCYDIPGMSASAHDAADFVLLGQQTLKANEQYRLGYGDALIRCPGFRHDRCAAPNNGAPYTGEGKEYGEYNVYFLV